MGSLYDGGFQRFCKLHARQLYAAGRYDSDAADDAGRGRVRRNGLRLYGMLAFAILAVFIAGLMVGRTPEFIGKKNRAV